jgi:hypothetical protein
MLESHSREEPIAVNHANEREAGELDPSRLPVVRNPVAEDDARLGLRRVLHPETSFRGYTTPCARPRTSVPS